MPPKRPAPPKGLMQVIGARTALLGKSLEVLHGDLGNVPGPWQEALIRELDKAALDLVRALNAHRSNEVITPAARVLRIKTKHPDWQLKQSGNAFTARHSDGRTVEAGSVAGLERELDKAVNSQ